MGGGGSTNWCTFKEVQEQNLGSGEKVSTCYHDNSSTIVDMSGGNRRSV